MRLFPNSYKKNAAAAAPRPANAGAMVIIGAPAVEASTAEPDDAALVFEGPVPAADPEPDPEEETDAEAAELEPVTEALPAEGVAAAEALGSKSSPAVITRGKLPK